MNIDDIPPEELARLQAAAIERERKSLTDAEREKWWREAKAVRTEADYLAKIARLRALLRRAHGILRDDTNDERSPGLAAEIAAALGKERTNDRR